MTDQRPSRDSRDSIVGPDDEGSVYDVSAPTPPAGIPLGKSGPDDHPDHDEDSPGVSRPALVDGELDLQAQAPQELVDLAAELGVATEYKDWQGASVAVSTRTLCGVLEAMDLQVRTGAQVRAALEEVRRRPWQKLLPDVTVVREGEQKVIPVHIDADLPLHRLEVRLETEDGAMLTLPLASEQPEESRATFDGQTFRRVHYVVLGDIPLGYHTLWARTQPPARYPGSENRSPARPRHSAPTSSPPSGSSCRSRWPTAAPGAS